MKYKDYDSVISFDEEARLFHGEVINIRDVITSQGTSVEDLEEAFHESVDDYLDFCASRGELPE
ncbi:MAG: type II toxin-antitoxin system HicB family antitoxin [Anaerolineaceae bacterium]